MGNPDKKKIAEAAEHVADRFKTEITEVIEADEDLDLALVDRFAAAAATFLVCGITYFGIWLWLDFQAGVAVNDAEPAVLLWLWTWQTPFIATFITTVVAFIRPGWAYRYFGKVTKVFAHILMFWS